MCLWWDKNSFRFCCIQGERTGRKKKSVAFQLPVENKQMLALEFLSWLMVSTNINMKLLLENFEHLVYFDFFVSDWLFLLFCSLFLLIARVSLHVVQQSRGILKFYGRLLII